MAKPIQSWKVKGIDVAAWQGKGGVSFSIRKSYKNKETGEWLESKYYYVDDLKNLANCIEQALAFVHREPEISTRSAAASIPLKERAPSMIQDDDDIPF